MSKSKIPRARSKRRRGGSPHQVRARSVRVAAERDGSDVVTVTIRTRSGLATVIRSSRSGRFTGAKSAQVIDRGAERFGATLKRLATK